MARSSSGLFVSCAENVFFVMFMHALLSGLMDLLRSADFSPGMRGVMFSQLVLALVTGGLILGLSAWDRTRLVFGAADGAPPPDQGSPIEQWVMQRLDRAKLTLGVCNAYCVFTLALFLLFFSEFLQALTGLGMEYEGSAAMEMRLRLSTNAMYASTPRLDWVQAIAGGSGWVQKVSPCM